MKHDAYDRHMDLAMDAELNPLAARLFADMAKLLPAKADDEPIPGRDDLEESNR
jgi:hypothetical protein